MDRSVVLFLAVGLVLNLQCCLGQDQTDAAFFETDGFLILNNSFVEFQFNNADGGFGLAQITSFVGTSGRYPFLLPPQGSSVSQALWSGDFRDNVGRSFIVDSNSPASNSYKVTSDQDGITAVFLWENINLGLWYSQTTTSVRVTVRLLNSSPMASFRITVNNPRESIDKPCLWSLGFVTINNIGATSGFDNTTSLNFPGDLGTSVSEPGGLYFQGVYPSGPFSMQFLSWCQQKDCLYYAAEDPAANYKQFVFNGDNYNGISDHHSMSQFYVSNFAPDSCSAVGGNVNETYDIPYDIVIGPYSGDWWDAAQIYRKWALENAEWTEKGPISNRTDMPEWFIETPIWFNTGWVNAVLNWSEGDPNIVVPRMKNIMRVFNLTTASLHWYCWHQIPFDTNYPEYFPPRAGFAEGIQALQELGVRVFPYINGRIFDYNAESWEIDQAIDFVVKNSAPRLTPLTLQPVRESYGSQQNFATMCPYTSFWQKKIANTVSELINAYGVDGTYVDQIAAAGAYSCFDPSHGHTLGGGDYWVEGYRELLDQVAVQAHKVKDGVIVTEANAEPYMGNLNGHLVISGFLSNCVIKNMFSAVYGGYTVPFGRVFYQQDLMDPNWFTLKISQMFVLGVQLGWIALGGSYGLYDQLVQPQYAPQVEFVQKLIQYRLLAREYLIYGKLMRDFPIAHESTYQVDFSCQYSTLPRAVWNNLDGTTAAILVTNPLPYPQNLQASMTFADYGLTNTNTYTVNRVTPGGTQLIGHYKTYATLNVTLQAFDVAMFEITP
eukprot:TRINITY_DN3588_c0_g1_i1.p1 TRINITY_DN3588_c0_g1~~TRINITY_DN3588_c0_g1_i1.p1  ORF type:complete len:789 (+),score=123.39 TRINITY_DN3588_c0_g1_i1:40-2367(+)